MRCSEYIGYNCKPILIDGVVASISATVVDILVKKIVAIISATAVDIYHIEVGRFVANILATAVDIIIHK